METTLTRRELLSKSTALLLMVPVAGAAVGCSSSNSSSPAPGGTNDGGEGSCQGIFETSTVTDNHTHALCVPETDLDAPPSAGVTYTTSVSENHSHTVALTQAQLQSVKGGTSLTVTTSGPAAHEFTIEEA
jgi:hypothetical protein